MCSNEFTVFVGFCGYADKNHIFTVLTVTTGPLRANNADMDLSENEFHTPAVQQNERRLTLALYLTCNEMV